MESASRAGLGRRGAEAPLDIGAGHHGVRAKAETIADLLIVDLAGEDELRRKVPELLQELQADGAVIEVGGEWRLQTKESAEWESAYRSEEKAILADQSGLTRSRRELLDEAIETALAGAASVTHGSSRQQRRIHRLRPDDKAPADGIPLRLRSGWNEDLAAVENLLYSSKVHSASRYPNGRPLIGCDVNGSVAVSSQGQATLAEHAVIGTGSVLVSVLSGHVKLR